MNIYEQIVLASLGFLSVSAKEVQNAMKRIAGKKLSKKELQKITSILIKEGQLRRKESEKMAQGLIKKALKELDIPTRSELKALESRLVRSPKKST